MDMKKIAVLLVAVVVLAGCAKEKPRATVLCGTSMIASLVRDYSPDIEAVTLIPPTQCPGHYDLKPADAEKIRRAKVFVIQGFQASMVNNAKALNPNLVIEAVNVPDLNVPQNYATAMSSINGTLNSYFPEKMPEKVERYTARIGQIKELMLSENSYLSSLKAKKIKVLCSVVQKGFAEFCGFEIAGVFGDPERLSVSEAARLVKQGKESSIKFVISNLSSNHGSTAEMLNRELGTKTITLANFPSEDSKDMFAALWEYNIAQIKAAIPE